ncbi:hypothetical protein ACFX2I_045564 [Malus domestica]
MTEARDRISDLPDEILHEIFSLVPVKSVAKNSALSRTWSHLWATLPVLDFNQVCPPMPKRLDHANELQVVLDEHMEALAFIPRVLFSRPENSNINVFRFSGRLMSLSCLEDCICRVVNHRVGELQLNLLMACGERFDLPHCVYECDSLRSLTLINATRIRLRSQPEDSKPRFCFSFSLVKATSGLCSLQALTLKCVDILDDHLTTDLFSDSSFPFLQNLIMKTCQGMTHLKISCSKLKDVRVVDMNLNSLDISGSRLENLTVRFCFENPSGDNKSRVNIFAPNLKVFRWQFNGYTDDCSIQNFPRLNAFYMHYWLEDDVSNVIIKNVVKLLSASSQISVLDIQSFGLLLVSLLFFFPSDFTCFEKTMVTSLSC